MQRSVSAQLVYWADAPASLEMQIAVSSVNSFTEELVVRSAGVELPVTELSSGVGTRIHQVQVSQGRLEISYRATIRGNAAPVAVEPMEISISKRPSRYCESDRLAGFAAAEFRGLTTPAELIPAVSSWVGDRLFYVPGSSGPTDGAVETLLTSRGVCRDYAHLTVALLRATGVPARLVSVYAPGLWPMDFHAVAEAAIDGQWRVVDPSLLAPRASLVRIATGRDAADVAFLSNQGGNLALEHLEVGAVVDGQLPGDDVTQLVSLT